MNDCSHASEQADISFRDARRVAAPIFSLMVLGDTFQNVGMQVRHLFKYFNAPAYVAFDYFKFFQSQSVFFLQQFARQLYISNIKQQPGDAQALEKVFRQAYMSTQRNHKNGCLESVSITDIVLLT